MTKDDYILKQTESKLESVEKVLVDKSSLIIEKYIPLIAYTIIFMSIFGWIVFSFIPNSWPIFIEVEELEMKIKAGFLTKDKTNMLITVGVFLVGFYVTVMSVLGSSYSAAVVKISEEGLSRKFVRIAVAAFFVGFSFLIITVIYDIFSNSTFFTFFYISLILLTLSEALRFSTIVMHIYYSNIKYAAQEIEKKTETEKQLIDILTRMESKLYNDSKTPAVDSIEYMKELRKKLKENEVAESKKQK